MENNTPNILQVQELSEVLNEAFKNAMEKMELTELNKDVHELSFKKTTLHGTSEQIKALFTSYAKYSGEVETPKTIKKGVHGANYAPLNEVFDCIKPALSKNGLALIQFPTLNGGDVAINNILTHKDGAYFVYESISARPTKNDVQGVGSTITYLKRYSASAIGGIASEPDDDGENASGLGNGNKPPATGKKTPPKKTPLQLAIADITKLVNEKVKINKEAVSEVMKLNDVKNHNKITDLELAKKVKKEISEIKKVEESKEEPKK